MIIKPIILDGINVGDVEQDGTEIHCVIKDEYKNTWLLHRTAMREFMQYFLDQDIVTTNNPEDDFQGIRRTNLLGFEETWRSDGHVFFMLKTPPFERKKHAA
jgi:hypothetical protein